jgi:hypothetical protein
LKQAMGSGALERIPPRYPLGAGSHDTIDYALALLAELGDPHASPRPLEEIVADAVRFRRWVESRQQISRRIILADTRQGEGFEPQPEPPTSRPERGRRPASDPPASRPRSARSDPMWDEFLDGLDL